MTTSPTQRRPLAARLALVSTVSLGLVAGPVAFAGPASAVPQDSKKVNCWIVKAHDPYLLKYHKKGHKKFAKVDFSFKIKCDKNAKVKYHHWIMEEKRHNKLIKEKRGELDVRKNYVKHENTRADVEKDKNNRVKVFHVVKIYFEKEKGKGWYGSDYEKSRTLVIRF